MVKIKHYTKYKILMSLVVAVLLFGIMGNVMSVSVSADTGKTPIRLMRIDFSAEDSTSIIGGDKQLYPIELWQDGSSDRISVSLMYNSNGVEKYLTPAAGSIVGFNYHYNALRGWNFKFKGKEYKAGNINIMFNFTPDNEDGESAITPDRVIDLPPTTIKDWNGNSLYYTDDGYLFNDAAELYYDDVNDTSNLLRMQVTDSPSTAIDGNVQAVADVEIKGKTYQIINGNGEPLSIDAESKRIVKPDYKIASISITDDLYAIPASDNGAPILCRKVIRDRKSNVIVKNVNAFFNFWGNTIAFVGSFGSHKFSPQGVVDDAFMETLYFDLWGHEIDTSLFAFSPDFVWGGLEHSMKPVMTVGDYIDELIQIGKPFMTDGGAENAIGEQLYDNLGSPISKLYGQLIDVAGYPLLVWVIDTNTHPTEPQPRPCYFDDNGYYDYNGEPLTIADIDGKKVLAKDEQVIYSVITNLQNGEDLYFTYLADGITMIPAHGKLNPVTGDVEFSDIDGNSIDNIIVKPNVNMADYYKKNPEDKPLKGWELFKHYMSVIFTWIAIIVVGIIAVSLIIFIIGGIVKLVKWTINR